MTFIWIPKDSVNLLMWLVLDHSQDINQSENQYLQIFHNESHILWQINFPENDDGFGNWFMMIDFFNDPPCRSDLECQSGDRCHVMIKIALLHIQIPLSESGWCRIWRVQIPIACLCRVVCFVELPWRASSYIIDNVNFVQLLQV